MSKIIQISQNAVLLIGGNNISPSLLTNEYDYPRSCLHLDLSLGILTQKSPMISARGGHAVAQVNNFIYAVAGQWMTSSERYDIFADKWCELPANVEFDEFGLCV